MEDAAFHLQQAIEKYLKGYYTVGTMKRKKSGVLLKRKTYIMLEMCIE